MEVKERLGKVRLAHVRGKEKLKRIKFFLNWLDVISCAN
jgi:hypothetical protein